ncbi:MAG: outer membrane beta-barrel protein [Marinobacter sp.]|nr:outer membrane beta-barrel protein [Marinobacter sp.]
MNLRHLTAIILGLTLTSPPAIAEVGISPFAGYRMGGSAGIESADGDTQDELRFEDTASHGIIFNFDLPEAGKQGEIYFGRQETSAKLDNGLFAPGTRAIDLTIYQLQFGGLYFPGGRTFGGFASGVIGVTRLEPDNSELDNHHRVALSLGGGYQFYLTDHLRLRLDLRAIYTALESGGSVFCSGGCAFKFRSNGYLQAEAGAGLVMRF